MRPYRLQYRIRKSISSCEGRQFKYCSFLTREGFVVDNKNCFTVTLIWVYVCVFFTKYKESS